MYWSLPVAAVVEAESGCAVAAVAAAGVWSTPAERRLQLPATASRSARGVQEALAFQRGMETALLAEEQAETVPH